MTRLLILGDSPTRNSGFARVVRNLVLQWQKLKAFDEIHVWGIGYWGAPHQFPGVNIWPAAGPADTRWESKGNLTRFANLVRTLKPTHTWMLHDTWALMPLSNVMEEFSKEISTTLYFPVDAPLEPYWTRIIASVRHPVAYCEYGRQQARQALGFPEQRERNPETPQEDWDRVQAMRAEARDRIQVIPHGADAHWRQTSQAERAETRQWISGNAILEHDLLLLSMAQNQRRKGLTQTLQTLSELRKLSGFARTKLYMHMTTENSNEGIHLGVIALQLGLVPGEDVFFGDRFHTDGHAMLTDDDLRCIYGCADMLLSTSLGEGWGLPLTEAMACRVPVAAPAHTSILDLLGQNGERGLLLPASDFDVTIKDNNRLRPRTDPRMAAHRIANATASQTQARIEAASAWVGRECMTWGVIAEQWVEVME